MLFRALRLRKEEGGGFCISPRNSVLVSGGYAKTPSLRGLFWVCQVESPKNAGFLARVEYDQQAQGLLSSCAGVLQLRLCKGRRLITLSLDPHRKDDPDPHISKRSDGNSVAFPLRSFALIVVLCPRFTLGALPCKLMQGVAQRFDAPQPAMSFGIHATLIEDRRGSSQCLQAVCILVALTIIPNLGVFAYPPETSTLFRGDMQKPPS